jgi:DnaA family protein
MIAGALFAPRASGFLLPDLKSRLTALPAFRLQSLDDDATRRALQLRAWHRGLDLPDDTAQFLLSRSRRDMASLYGVLDRLDDEALRAQRRLTIPFVKGVLDITG